MSDDLMVRSCGARDPHLKLVCALDAGHGRRDPHRSGNLAWFDGQRPRVTDDPLPASALERPRADSERLGELLQVLLTARSKMLGLGEGLRQALGHVDPAGRGADVLRGLVSALGEIVATISRFTVQEGDTALSKDSRLAADRGMHEHFRRGLAQPARSSRLLQDSEDRDLGRDAYRAVVEGQDLAAEEARAAEGGCHHRFDTESRCVDCKVTVRQLMQLQLERGESDHTNQSTVHMPDTWAAVEQYRAMLDQHRRRAGRDLDAEEQGVLVRLTEATLGLGVEVPVQRTYEAFKAVAERLHALGYVRSEARAYRPTLAGVRLALLWVQESPPGETLDPSAL